MPNPPRLQYVKPAVSKHAALKKFAQENGFTHFTTRNVMTGFVRMMALDVCEVCSKTCQAPNAIQVAATPDACFSIGLCIMPRELPELCVSEDGTKCGCPECV